METATIFDLKKHAYKLLGTNIFRNREEKLSLEYNLQQTLRELTKIKNELSNLNHSTLVSVPEYNEEDDEINNLIRMIKNRVKVLPLEPVNQIAYPTLRPLALEQ